MPLYTEIHRDGEPIEVRWGWWHVRRMQEAAILDAHPELDPEVASSDPEFWVKFRGTRLATTGQQTIRGNYLFLDESDGEEFEIRAGDVLLMTA